MEKTPPPGKFAVPMEDAAGSGSLVPAEDSLPVVSEWRRKPGKATALSLGWFGLLGFGWEMINNGEYAVAEFIFAVAASIFVYQVYSFGTRRSHQVLALILGALIFGGSALDVLNVKGHKPWSNFFITMEPVLKVSRLEPMAFVMGSPPEVRLHLASRGVPTRAGIQYETWALRHADYNDQERKDLEKALWAKFSKDSAVNKPEILNIAADQDQWIGMTGKVAISNDDMQQTPPQVRYYFLAKVVAADGTVLAESCFYFLVSTSAYITYCTDHN